MRSLLWIVAPFVLFGCMWERDHRHGYGHREGDWWGYEEAEPHHHDYRDRWDNERGQVRDASCPSDADEDASLAESDLMPVVDAGKPGCEADSDCEAGSYCERESGDCLSGTTCEDESSCDPGFNCDPERSLCLPADMERCSELSDESTCAERGDCVSTYAGINCTCGPDCTCMGGEPNCVCERFEFHACADVAE